MKEGKTHTILKNLLIIYLRRDVRYKSSLEKETRFQNTKRY